MKSIILVVVLGAFAVLVSGAPESSANSKEEKTLEDSKNFFQLLKSKTGGPTPKDACTDAMMSSACQSQFMACSAMCANYCGTAETYNTDPCKCCVKRNCQPLCTCAQPACQDTPFDRDYCNAQGCPMLG